MQNHACTTHEHIPHVSRQLSLAPLALHFFPLFLFPTQAQFRALFLPLYTIRNRIVESRHGLQELQVAGQIDDTPSHEQRIVFFATHEQFLQMYDPLGLVVRN